MIRNVFLISFLLISVSISIFCTSFLYTKHKESQDQIISRFVEIPPALIKTISLGFKGVVSDYLLLKTMTFVGEKKGRNVKISKKEWKHVYNAINQITILDPHFWDPYVLAEMLLVWDGGMVDEGNSLLLNAARIRTEDYRPYFYLWFNHHYFLKESTKAEKFLELAAKKPGAPTYLTALASRLKLYSGQTASGIIFLEEILKDTIDPATREYLLKRLNALKIIAFLESKVVEYKNRFDAVPSSIHDMLSKGIISEIPEDPYGGYFYLSENGRIYTTSELREKKKE